MRSSVTRGYATAGTDTGHQGGSGRFALDDALAQVNFGHVAVHRTAEVAKAIIRAHYGDVPKYSYFLGCSRGGGQAMMASQRYPEDFDGIVAGAPAFDWTALSSLFLRVGQAFYPDPDVLDKTLISREEVNNLRDEISVRYDEQDGLKDGIISDPSNIEVNLDSIGWLSKAQRDAIKTIYEGVRNENGQISPGFPVGSEIEWFNWLIGPVPGEWPTNWFGFGVDIYRYFAFNDPDWDYSTYDFSTWAKDTRMTASTLNAVDTDLSDFRERGGKLIIWHGWSDAALSTFATIGYYDELLAQDANAADYTRLYLIPGCGHCGGGPGVSDVDWLDVIVNWVEKGRAPETVIATKPAMGDRKGMTRPLAPYPNRIVYKGAGDPHDAANFVSVRP
jgi:feruloyl esterase